MEATKLKQMEHEARLILRVADNEKWEQGDITRVLANLALEAAAELQAAPALLAVLTEKLPSSLPGSDFPADLDTIAGLIGDLGYSATAREIRAKAQAIHAAVGQAGGGVMENELECDSCGWVGDSAELDEDGCCPDCGSSELVGYVPDEDVIEDDN